MDEALALTKDFSLAKEKHGCSQNKGFSCLKGNLAVSVLTTVRVSGSQRRLIF